MAEYHCGPMRREDWVSFAHHMGKWETKFDRKPWPVSVAERATDELLSGKKQEIENKYQNPVKAGRCSEADYQVVYWLRHRCRELNG